jgi:hypothetical protein
MCRIQKRISEYRIIIHSAIVTHFDKSNMQQSHMNNDSNSNMSRVSMKIVTDSKRQQSMTSIEAIESVHEDTTEKIMILENNVLSFRKIPISAEILNNRSRV